MRFMVASVPTRKITWELLPDDFVLDDEPVDNVNQPPLAAALTESLALAGKLPDDALVTTNYGICSSINDQIVVKAPDWAYIPKIQVPRAAIKRSYTPHKQGDPPVVIMEFLSDTEGGEYSSKQTHPPGKWFFYEQILQVPNYIIFEPDSGVLEVHRLDASGKYELRLPDERQRYWMAEMALSIGLWRGKRENRDGYWLRWWNEEGDLLLWGTEQVEQERAAKESALQRLAVLEQRLREAGID